MRVSQKSQHVNDLIAWIEDHLSDDLHIDTIAKKSGYSKWHMQRMFKDFTGLTIASYTRKRRLTQSAMALRLTRLSLIDIALRYRFETQQNFTRMFKNQFSITPHAFRRAQEFDVSAFQSRFRSQHLPALTSSLVELDKVVIEGERYQYDCAYSEFVNDHASVIARYQQAFIARYAQQPQQGYIFYDYLPSEHKIDQHSVQLICGICPSAQSRARMRSRFTTDAGEYLQFHYCGHPDDLTRFIISIYYHYLPQSGFYRRAGFDIQKIDLTQSGKALLVCDFYVPVKKFKFWLADLTQSVNSV